ncbi:MAG: hypothetical protein ACTHK4_02050 [Mycobacteriales bacterium]
MATAAARKALPLRSTTTRPRPKLVVIPGQRVVGRMPFVLLIGGMLLASLIALLMLHTLAAQDAFHQTSLQQRLAALTDTEQHLQQQVQMDAAPDSLRARARALGMVPSVITGYRRLPNGRVVAHEVAANSPAAAAAAATAMSSTSSSTSTTTTSAAAGTSITTKQPGPAVTPTTAASGTTTRQHANPRSATSKTSKSSKQSAPSTQSGNHGAAKR